MIIIQIFYHILYIIYINERRSILQQLLTNVTEYGIKDIAKILPIGEQQIRRYIGTGELKAVIKRNRYRVAEEDLKAFMIEKGFTNLNL